MTMQRFETRLYRYLATIYGRRGPRAVRAITSVRNLSILLNLSIILITDIRDVGVCVSALIANPLNRLPASVYLFDGTEKSETKEEPLTRSRPRCATHRSPGLKEVATLRNQDLLYPGNY
ncbi:unnamed protein product [Xylocopa violacea]|uniref:Uncharacterized protein n=1 Tax=Xylocopa violacea TaxID=135666 RepID=A0ABP1NF77_XYLVO